MYNNFTEKFSAPTEKGQKNLGGTFFAEQCILTRIGSYCCLCVFASVCLPILSMMCIDGFYQAFVAGAFWVRGVTCKVS